MKHQKIFAILAIFCLLIGSAYAVAKLMPAVVDENKCIGCGECVKGCPIGAIALNEAVLTDENLVLSEQLTDIAVLRRGKKNRIFIGK